FLHESMLRWTGWSLAAPRPGKALSTDPNATGPVDAASTATPAFPIVVSFVERASTLPRLRFGRSYRLCARAADLAGNGLRLGDAAGSVAFATPPTAYHRYEPVPPPMLLLAEARPPGQPV